MQKIPVEQAVGSSLCHDITAMRGSFKGAAFKRGHIIRQEDVERLLDLGKKYVFIWDDPENEVHEEECARRLAAMAPVPGAHYTGPSEGKVQLIADVSGMLRINRELLHQINSIGDITIATLPDHYPVQPGARLASMRIVPLVTQECRIAQAERLCAGQTLMQLLPYQPRRVGIVITGSEIYNHRIEDRFEPVLRDKLRRYPAEIIGVVICDDDPEMISAAARSQLHDGADFLIFTGGMSVDPDDVTPTAIRALGAEIITHGVPAQPGNMTLVARLGSIPILGVPGAAICLPTTILDVLLPQIFSGLPLTRQDLIRLEDGGLCQLCSTCHWPNCTFGRY